MLKRTLMSMVTLVFILSFTTQTLSADTAQPKWMSGPVKEMLDKARASVKHITIQDLKKAIDGKEDMIVLDVRERNEYEVAHIPGAVNIPRGLLEFSIWSVIPDKNAKIYVYCKTGARAALATKQLNEFGYKNAAMVDPGGAAWAKAGYPVQTSISDEEWIIVPAAQGNPPGQ